MLAEKLLAKTNFDCSRELRTMELLKLRFGDGNMHNAEIMLVVSALNASQAFVKPAGGACKPMHTADCRSVPSRALAC